MRSPSGSLLYNIIVQSVILRGNAARPVHEQTGPVFRPAPLLVPPPIGVSLWGRTWFGKTAHGNWSNRVFDSAPKLPTKQRSSRSERHERLVHVTSYSPRRRSTRVIASWTIKSGPATRTVRPKSSSETVRNPSCCSCRTIVAAGRSHTAKTPLADGK